MGAIVSTRKSPGKVIESTAKKSVAVNAFRDVKKRSQNSDKDEQSNKNLPTEGIPKSIASWGQGIKSEKNLEEYGQVTSRNISAEVKDPHIIGRSSRRDESEAATKIQSYYRSYQERKRFKTKVSLLIKLQSCVRGYQTRKQLDEEQKSAVVIQTKFRRHLKARKRKPPGDSAVTKEKPQERKSYGTSSWREDTSTRLQNESKRSMEIGEGTKENFMQYKSDIDELRWESEKKEEENLSLKNSSSQAKTLLLIASNIEKTDRLEKAAKNDVISQTYDFFNCDLSDIYEMIETQLIVDNFSYKAKNIGFVCQGGPGYFYILQGKVITTKKLKKDIEIKEFFQNIGRHMSKINHEETKIHIISNNICGNKNGSDLLKMLSKAILPNKVKVEAPLEITKIGLEMLEDYFDVDCYKLWKRSRYLKT